MTPSYHSENIRRRGRVSLLSSCYTIATAKQQPKRKEEYPMNIIAMDTHMASIDAAVVNERGTLVTRTHIATSEKRILEFVQSIKNQGQFTSRKERWLPGWWIYFMFMGKIWL
jgi:hypothetical protein